MRRAWSGLRAEAAGDDFFLELSDAAKAGIGDQSQTTRSGRMPRRRPLLKRRSLSGAHGLRGGCDLALGLLAGGLALDADQQLLTEHCQDAVEHRDRGDVLTAFQLGDE